MKFAVALQQFDKLVKRERRLIFSACVCAVLGGTYALVVDPALMQAKLLNTRSHEHRAELETFQAAKADFEGRLQHDVNAEVKRSLEETKRDLSDLETRIKDFHHTLIPAQSMAKVIAGLLNHASGVRLISLRNIPPEPLSLDGVEKKHQLDIPPTKPARTTALLYKHGIDLVVEGAYFDLLNYLTYLEKQPWRVIWTETSLTAEHPVSRLHLKLHTLSMDPNWLSV